MLKIKADIRKSTEDIEKLRKAGTLPAVFYGAGNTTTSISISEKDFEKIWKSAGESTTVTLITDKGEITTLIHDVQLDPVKHKPIHADFLAIDINKVVRLKIPIEFIGVSEAVKNGLGVLVKVMHELEIEALPKNLPHNITIDIGSLATLTDQIAVKDVVLPTGVTSISKADEIIAAVKAQKEEKEEVVAPVDLSAIEVEKKGKKDLPAEESGEGNAPISTEKAK